MTPEAHLRRGRHGLSVRHGPSGCLYRFTDIKAPLHLCPDDVLDVRKRAQSLCIVSRSFESMIVTSRLDMPMLYKS